MISSLPSSSISQSITIPIFGSNSTQHPEQVHAGQEVPDWYPAIDDGEQDVDFDLLAEYLLEENPTVNHTVSLDFNNDYVVSPEQSVDGTTVAAGDNIGAAAQARDIITQHAATIATTIVHATTQPALTNANATTSQPFNTDNASQQQHQPEQSTTVYAPVSNHSLLIAPPAALNQIAANGVAVPTTITQYTSQPAMAPLVSAPVTTTTKPKVLLTTKAGQKKMGGAIVATTEAKRRRTNPPEVAAQGLINTSYLTNPVNMSPAVVAAAAAAAAMQGRGRKKTQAQIDRRRERNRILARRTRLRKKFFFESLQKEVIELQRENAALKDIVRTEVDSEEARQLLDQSNAARQLPQEVLEACGENPDLDQQDFNLITSIQQSQHSFVITDPSLQDNPIVFASDDFLTLTGYSREDVLGRNFRFLHGERTSKEKLDHIRKGLATGDDVSVTLVNYTADGTPFWNKLFIAALRDAQNNIVNFIAVIVKVASPEPGDPDFGTIIGDEDEDEQQQVAEEEEEKEEEGKSSAVQTAE